jgi:hypothetical protein
MNAWLIKTLKELLPSLDVNESTIDDCLLELKKHSLKMVTFLAKFYRQYGSGPKILDFLRSPTTETLKKSADIREDVNE